MIILVTFSPEKCFLIQIYISYGGDGIFVHKSIATINPYPANASANATTKKALKNASSRSDNEEIAAVPTVFIAIELPITADETAIAAEIANIIAVGEL